MFRILMKQQNMFCVTLDFGLFFCIFLNEVNVYLLIKKLNLIHWPRSVWSYQLFYVTFLSAQISGFSCCLYKRSSSNGCYTCDHEECPIQSRLALTPRLKIFPIWLPSSEDNISGFFPLDFSPLELFSFYYVASIPCLKALAIDSLLTMISILYLTIVTFLELILQTKFEHKFMLRSF